MRTPPFLMAAVVLFWGWQSGFLPEAAGMAVILEGPRFFKARWELSDTDIIRFCNFCTLLGLAAVIFAFTNNEGPTDFGKLFSQPNLQNTRLAGDASTLAAISLIRWLPMVYFSFAAAQAFSSRTEFPLDTVWAYLRYQRHRALKRHRPAPRVYHFNATWPYFVLCLYSASAHASEDASFFWGACGLIAWALWSQRPQSFTRKIWVILLAVVIAGGFFGQHGLIHLGRLTDFVTNYNPKWLEGMIRQNTDPGQSRTTLGQIGRRQMSSQIVLRVAPVNGANVPTYLREATYRNYQANRVGSSWTVGGPRNDFTEVHETPPDSERWPLQPGRNNHSQVHIACYLNAFDKTAGTPSGLLPLPVDCDRLEQLYAVSLQANSVGDVLADGPGLVMFNASFGSDGAVDTPPGTNSPTALSEDLFVPVAEKPALDQVIGSLPLAGLGVEKKLQAVRRYFAANYTYTLWQEPPKSAGTNETALATFLLHTHAGHCEYFATAAVLLLRELGIPARYAVGYVVHEPAGHEFVVRERDAHAWCLVWDADRRLWRTMDTTPGSWIAAEESRASRWQSLRDFFSWLSYQFAKFRWGQSHLRPYLLLGLVPVLAYFLYQIIFHRREHKALAAGQSAARTVWPGLDSEFYLLEKKLAAQGCFRRPGQSQSDWLKQAATAPDLAGLREPLRQLLNLHYRYRFDPRGLSPAEREELRRQARECLAAMR